MNRFCGTAVTLVLCCGSSFAAEPRLLDAARHQDMAGVQAALKQGADVNLQQPDGATALHWAAYSDNKPLVDALLKAGAKPNVANELGVTPLMLACQNRNADIVAALLEAGADPNARSAAGETAVLQAARYGNPAVMKALLAKGAEASAKETLQNQSALMWAVAEHHADVAQLLIDHGADVNARTNVPPPRPRMGAAGQGGAKAVAAGNSGTAPGGNAPKPAVVGGGEGGAIAAAAAAQGYYIPQTSDGFTALLFAARVGDLECTKMLLKAGADPNAKAADNLTPLILATVRAHPAVATYLLDHGADANADGPGYTALHWASGTWESELTVRAITVDREGSEWRTVAGLRDGKVDLVKALLAHGADPNAKLKRAPARAGGSKNPALPELKDATPLMLAAMAGDTAVMKALVAGGADPKLQTVDHGTILMAAAGLGHVQGEDFIRDSDALEAAKFAVQLGIDPKAVDGAGDTALHYAAYMRHDAVANYLVSLGVPLEAKNKFGETALWDAELVLQFMGGGTYVKLPSSTSELLKKLGAKPIDAPYALARPMDWPDQARSAGDQAGAVVAAPAAK